MNSERRAGGFAPRRAFSLVELIAVLVLVGILSAAVAPALSRAGAANSAGLARELERLLRTAHAAATATGMPTGVRFDLAQQEAEMVRIEAPGEQPEPVAATASGSTRRITSETLLVVGQSLAGARIESIDLGPAGADTVWFDFRGTPHLRTAMGAEIGPISTPATIEVSDGNVVTVYPYTGMVAR